MTLLPCHDLIGAHVSTKGGLHTIFERGRAIGATALALFSKNSTQWAAKELTDDDCLNFRRLRAELSMPAVLVHASYLINLAATSEVVLEKSIAAMIVDLERAERLGADALVLHPGAHMRTGFREGLERICRSLDQIHVAIPECRTITLLETAAGQGSCLGSSFDELGTVIRGVDDKGRLGICIDTCHVFSA